MKQTWKSSSKNIHAISSNTNAILLQTVNSYFTTKIILCAFFLLLQRIPSLYYKIWCENKLPNPIQYPTEPNPASVQPFQPNALCICDEGVWSGKLLRGKRRFVSLLQGYIVAPMVLENWNGLDPKVPTATTIIFITQTTQEVYYD